MTTKTHAGGWMYAVAIDDCEEGPKSCVECGRALGRRGTYRIVVPRGGPPSGEHYNRWAVRNHRYHCLGECEPVPLRVTGSRYYCEVVEAEQETESGITLPDDSAETPTDAMVLGVGPGRVLDSGARYPMQAKPGDRVVYERHAFDAYDGRRGFVHDAKLVAIIPGPGHDCLLPANDWVLVRPDPLKRVDRVTGAVVEASSSPVLVALNSLAGDTRRVRIAAELAVQELRALERSERFMLSDAYDRERLVHNYLDGVPADVRREMNAVFHGVETGAKRAPVAWRDPSNHGEVLGVGPGRVREDPNMGVGRYGWDGPYWFHACGDGAQAPVALRAGSRVYWDRSSPQVRMSAGVLVRADSLCCVEVE